MEICFPSFFGLSPKWSPSIHCSSQVCDDYWALCPREKEVVENDEYRYSPCPQSASLKTWSCSETSPSLQFSYQSRFEWKFAYAFQKNVALLNVLLWKRSAFSETEGEEEKEERKDECSCDCSVAEKRRREGENPNERTNKKVVSLCLWLRKKEVVWRCVLWSREKRYCFALYRDRKEMEKVRCCCCYYVLMPEEKMEKFAAVVVITFLCRVQLGANNNKKTQMSLWLQGNPNPNPNPDEKTKCCFRRKSERKNNKKKQEERKDKRSWVCNEAEKKR